MSSVDPGGQAGAAHRGGVEAGTLRFDEVVEAVLSQQLIQPTMEGMTRGVGKFVAVTHVAGCRSRVRVPIDMGEV